MPWGGSLECLGEIGQVENLAADGSPTASADSKVLETWMLMVGILAILNTQNKGVPAGLEAVVVGVTDPGHHAIHGCQLWAPNQPRPGPRPTAFHLRSWLGP